MRRLIVVAAVIIGLALGYFLVAAQRSAPPTPTADPRPQGPQVGAQAPDFTLTTLDGKTLSLSQFRGKVVMLNFWASWCPPCRAEMPSVEKLYLRMKKTGDFVLLAVNVESNARQAIKDFAGKNSLNFPILLDQEQGAAKLYQVSGIPQTYIIDPRGVIVRKVEGGRDWNTPQIATYLTSLGKGE